MPPTYLYAGAGGQRNALCGSIAGWAAGHARVELPVVHWKGFSYLPVTFGHPLQVVNGQTRGALDKQSHYFSSMVPPSVVRSPAHHAHNRARQRAHAHQPWALCILTSTVDRLACLRILPAACRCRCSSCPDAGWCFYLASCLPTCWWPCSTLSLAFVPARKNALRVLVLAMAATISLPAWRLYHS